jgi:mannosyltransferase
MWRGVGIATLRGWSIVDSGAIWLGLIAAAAAWLRCATIGDPSLWLDEAHSVAYARLPLSVIWGAAAQHEVNPPLYFTLLKAWMAVFGASEVAVRGLSAAVGVISIAVAFRLGRHVAGTLPGLATAVLLASCALHVHYSQEARGYMLALLASLAAVYGAIRILEADSPKGRLRWAWAAYIVGSIVAIYTHSTLLLCPVLISIAATFVWWRHDALSWPFAARWLLAGVVILAAYAPWLQVLRANVAAMGDFWVAPVTIANAKLGDLFEPQSRIERDQRQP